MTKQEVALEALKEAKKTIELIVAGKSMNNVSERISELIDTIKLLESSEERQPVLSFQEFKKEYGTVEFTNVVNFAKEIVIVGDDALKMKYKWYLLGCNQSLPASQPSITFEEFEKECKKLGLTCISENGQIDKYTSVKIKEFYDKIIGCNQPPLEGGVFNAEKFLDGINCCTITEDAADVKENYYYNYKDLVKELIKLQSPKPVEPKELMKKFFEWDAANKFTSTQKDIWEWFLPYLNKPVEGDVRAEAIKIADKSVGSYSNSLTKSIATAVVDALLSKYNITRKG